ncbi:hypothetical protein RRG08_011792 [Elysia crispata]|uniref:Uncharacterized protein n=1 Tax=Elysia crispata TaxID=231223 RepID=A0AAE1AV14_9GAST|nr:hypothetical protein RRG08_011792 [Elysia crispata]
MGLLSRGIRLSWRCYLKDTSRVLNYVSDNSWNCRLLGSALKHKLCPEQIILVEYRVWDFLGKVPKDHLHQTSYQPG